MQANINSLVIHLPHKFTISKHMYVNFTKMQAMFLLLRDILLQKFIERVQEYIVKKIAFK